MKFYKDVLKENTLALIHRELSNFMEQKGKWSCSNFVWSDLVRHNIAGSTIMADVSDGLTQMIFEDLENLIPSMTNPKIQYFVWTQNAGIAAHNDAKWKFGATIYLNESWNINDGGIFIYEHDVDDWRAHIPTFNTMAVNDDTSWHMVTPVSPFAKHNRYTLQIFGDKVNE